MSDDKRNDPAFLQLAADVVKAGQETGDDRILEMVHFVCNQVATSGLLPTMMLQYGALLERESELMAEIEEGQETIQMARRAAG